jgi:hypothetical protein
MSILECESTGRWGWMSEHDRDAICGRDRTVEVHTYLDFSCLCRHGAGDVGCLGRDVFCFHVTGCAVLGGGVLGAAVSPMHQS